MVEVGDVGVWLLGVRIWEEGICSRWRDERLEGAEKTMPYTWLSETGRNPLLRRWAVSFFWT